MEYTITGKVMVTFDHKNGSTTSQHIATDFNLSVSSNLSKAHYLDPSGLPTAAGSKSLTVAFIQGLVGNIHAANQKGYWKDSEHIRYIIEELQRGFVQIADVNPGNWKDDEKAK